MGVDEALVHALVAATHQHGAGAGSQLLHTLLGEALACGAEPDHGQARRWRLATDRIRHRGGIGRLARADGRQTAHQRLDQHHHARPATEGAIVDAAVDALGVVAQGPQAHIDGLRLEGAARHAHLLEGGEQFGEQGDDVEANGHGVPIGWRRDGIEGQ